MIAQNVKDVPPIARVIFKIFQNALNQPGARVIKTNEWNGRCI